MSEQDYEQLTLFRGDFHVSRFPWLESKKGKGTTVTSGRKCSELSESLRRVGFLVRTYLESCDLPPGTWSRTWSVKAITSQCLILKLRLSERRTGGNELRLLPTVTASDINHSINSEYPRGNPHLAKAAMMWPTPTARDYKDGTAKSCENVPVNGLLGRAIHLYATPNARDWKNSTAKEWDNPKNTRNLNRQIAKLCDGGESIAERNGQLNPTWVEWLMGFPLGWTELNASETR